MSESYFIFELTTSCNLNCTYCYNVWKQDQHIRQKHLEINGIKKITANLKNDVFIKGITLAGGEPLLHVSIFDIVSLFRKENIRINLATNGILLSEENILRLIDSGVGQFEISLPSLNKETYQALCEEDFSKIVRKAMLNIKKHNVLLAVTTVLTSKNYQQTYDIIELASVFGADYFVINRFVPGGQGLKNAKELNITADRMEFSLQLADQAAFNHKIPVTIAIPLEHCLFNTKKFKHLLFGSCVCGDYKWVVDPYGNLRCCEQNPVIIGNLLKDSFSFLIQSDIVKVFRDNHLKSECIACNDFQNCGGGCRFCR